MWSCVCTCGNKKVASGLSLRGGNTKSCGCLRKTQLGKSRLLNLEGQRFGRLVAVRHCAADYKTTSPGGSANATAETQFGSRSALFVAGSPSRAAAARVARQHSHSSTAAYAFTGES
jgi:hypothetical protein